MVAGIVRVGILGDDFERNEVCVRILGGVGSACEIVRVH